VARKMNILEAAVASDKALMKESDENMSLDR
jgi:hypothetical protein